MPKENRWHSHRHGSHRSALAGGLRRGVYYIRQVEKRPLAFHTLEF